MKTTIGEGAGRAPGSNGDTHTGGGTAPVFLPVPQAILIQMLVPFFLYRMTCLTAVRDMHRHQTRYVFSKGKYLILFSGVNPAHGCCRFILNSDLDTDNILPLWPPSLSVMGQKQQQTGHRHRSSASWICTTALLGGWLDTLICSPSGLAVHLQSLGGYLQAVILPSLRGTNFSIELGTERCRMWTRNSCQSSNSHNAYSNSLKLASRYGALPPWALPTVSMCYLIQFS